MGPGAGSRPNLERAAHRLYTFTNADEAESGAPCCIDVEPNAVIGDDERETIRAAAQMHRHRARFAVFERILHRLLSDSEQTQGQIRRKGRWDVLVREGDCDLGMC